ncbi:galectin-2 isoform X2 [Nycticebus coucang]|uniref:galectin-2 isoform X2 n=1 Tax=Nycticebus coucang TaxID=9470 RepID=UPI00234C0CCD|nr:galectin-2 isoform X2 [Nycticebus coucang]
MSGEFDIRNMNMKPGTTLKIKGRIADNTDGFTINLGQASDKLNLHFNPRFKESTIVCNSLDGSQWGQEKREDHPCFSPGSEVKFTVTFESDKFNVKLPDGHQMTFPNRLGNSHLNYLGVRGGFSVSSFKVE